MPPADCTHLVQRRSITQFLIVTGCLSGNIRQKEDFIDCKYTVCDICEVGHVYVCMCEEMFVSRMNYNISLLPFFIY